MQSACYANLRSLRGLQLLPVDCSSPTTVTVGGQRRQRREQVPRRLGREHRYRARHVLPVGAKHGTLHDRVSHLHALTLPIARISGIRAVTLCNAASLRPHLKSGAAQLPHTRALREAYARRLPRVQSLALSDSRMHHSCSLEGSHWPDGTGTTPEQVGARWRARVMPLPDAFAICKVGSRAAHETLPTLYASALTANVPILSYVQEALP
jgi:hypothetical protein